MLKFVEDWFNSHQAELKEAAVVWRVKHTPSDSCPSILVELVSAAADAYVIAWDDGRMDALVGRMDAVVGQSPGDTAFSAHADFGADYQVSAAHFLAIVLDQMTD